MELLNFIEIIWEFYQFTISVEQQFNFMSVNIFENCVTRRHCAKESTFLSFQNGVSSDDAVGSQCHVYSTIAIGIGVVRLTRSLMSVRCWKCYLYVNGLHEVPYILTVYVQFILTFNCWKIIISRLIVYWLWHQPAVTVWAHFIIDISLRGNFTIINHVGCHVIERLLLCTFLRYTIGQGKKFVDQSTRVLYW